MDVWNIYLQMGRILQIEVLHCITDIIPRSSRAMALQLPFQIIRIYNCLSEFTTCVISAKQNIKPLAFPCSLNLPSLFPYSVQPFFSSAKITHSSFLSEQNITVQIAEEMQHTSACRKEWCTSGWGEWRGSSWRLGKVFLCCQPAQSCCSSWAGEAVLVPANHGELSPEERSLLGLWDWALSPGPGSAKTEPWQTREGERCELQPHTGARQKRNPSLGNPSSQEKGANAKLHKAPRGSRRGASKSEDWASLEGRRAAPPHGAAACTAQTPRASATAEQSSAVLKNSLVPSHWLHKPQNCTTVHSWVASSSVWVPASLERCSKCPKDAQSAPRAENLREGQAKSTANAAPATPWMHSELFPHLPHAGLTPLQSPLQDYSNFMYSSVKSEVNIALHANHIKLVTYKSEVLLQGWHQGQDEERQVLALLDPERQKSLVTPSHGGANARL